MNLEELQKLDDRRKEKLEFGGELAELRSWIDIGYKECDGKQECLKILDRKINRLKNTTDAMFDLIQFKRKKLFSKTN